MRRGLAVGIVFATLLGSAFSAVPITIQGYRIPTPPTIDGIVHEDGEWKGVPSLEGLVDLGTGEKAPDAATFWIAYDKDYIYVAA
ncbi:MAG TPA: hypothetical protein VG944_05375, partial [Fimbriimonas sp.]|nr:hypothetical protein [Fimbriimonas sp.]